MARSGEAARSKRAVSADGPVAGRIEAAPSDLAEALDAWAAYLSSRGKKPGSIKSMRGFIRSAARDAGWSSVSDLTFDAITGWLAGRRPNWQGTTYNRNLSCFRSLTKFLVASKRLTDDPLSLADRAEESGNGGPRAATTEEARSLIRVAWAREQADARCKCPRALYWAVLFLHGARPNEPDLWRRKHLVLDHEIPHVHWAGEIQKSHREMYVALAPELVPLLREHLASIDRLRAVCRRPPPGPDDPVFPKVPNRGVFNEDRRRAGIADVDYRRRPFTRRSGRKWFSTALTAAGVPEKMVDHLMRHSGRPEHRYYDPPLAEQAAALARLPGLWPVSYPQTAHNPQLGLDTARGGGDAQHAGPPHEEHPRTNPTTTRPRPATGGSAPQAGSLAGGLGAARAKRTGRGRSESAREDRDAGVVRHGNGQGRT
ncbi:MAG: tyrosine-type recombinase/integrase [Phycisphaeraceae bacterium]|nr:tyrosine-type recombinase/integrase [Phycisphaeraceae bacterium]